MRSASAARLAAGAVLVLLLLTLDNHRHSGAAAEGALQVSAAGSSTNDAPLGTSISSLGPLSAQAGMFKSMAYGGLEAMPMVLDETFKSSRSLLGPRGYYGRRRYYRGRRYYGRRRGYYGRRYYGRGYRRYRRGYGFGRGYY